MNNACFWQYLEQLVVESRLTVDRPRGSLHPRYPDSVYPLDYGYLAGTRAGDGEGIDVWIGSLTTQRITGIICTVDSARRDAEIKLLLGCTSDDMQMALDHHNRGGQAGLLILRPEPTPSAPAGSPTRSPDHRE